VASTHRSIGADSLCIARPEYAALCASLSTVRTLKRMTCSRAHDDSPSLLAKRLNDRSPAQIQGVVWNNASPCALLQPSVDADNNEKGYRVTRPLMERRTCYERRVTHVQVETQTGRDERARKGCSKLAPVCYSQPSRWVRLTYTLRILSCEISHRLAMTGLVSHNGAWSHE